MCFDLSIGEGWNETDVHSNDKGVPNKQDATGVIFPYAYFINMA